MVYHSTNWNKSRIGKAYAKINKYNLSMEYLNTEKVIAIIAGGIAIIGNTYTYLFYFLIIRLLKNWNIIP